MNLLERIDHWTKITPAAFAHVSGQRTLTYGELGVRANSLSANLVEKYGNNRAPIAVLGHREPEMLIAFIGVVKSGRPYIPIDTALPPERIGQILDIAKPVLVLTPEKIAALSQSGKPSPPRPFHPDDPFYIIFTSGSTGTPKGIVITLGCLDHFVEWMLHEQTFGYGCEVFLNQAPFSFDLSVMDLYCSLATGSTLFSISRDLLVNPKLLYRALADSNITTWISTPSFVEMCLIERTFDGILLQRVRRFLFCGETLPADTARSLLDRFPNAEIWNLYGPSETTVATTSVKIVREILGKYSSLPIGHPMPGVELFLIDKNQNILSPGSRGEIVIQGPNVSPGYLRNPDLTAARFFEVNGRRAYRTGDWGRFRDGFLFFEGRIDDQIKLNGYRIELGDLEMNLRALPMVRDAAVVPVSKNGKVQWLAGFVVPNSGSNSFETGLTNQLRESLRERLPAYMMPRKFVLVDRFPITTNGKVDRSKLAELL
ncbi:MAG TPA: D-alanine--poly(phosphoribitol) ligase subunit DltA [Chthoniobacterales bacterium]|nr:D-alanine--poly(phosphoribitol) ligase subunit DltA [Chthoniobacterales bacterium]